MGNDNGTKFAIPQGVPIIGQAATVKSWCCQVVVTCNCPAKEPVLLVVGLLAQCPACHRAFQITKVGFSAQTGQVELGVGLVAMREPVTVPEGVPS